MGVLKYSIKYNTVGWNVYLFLREVDSPPRSGQ